MSFALPSVKCKPEHDMNRSCINEGSFGVPNIMLGGLGTINNVENTHPLIESEQNFYKNKENLNMIMLRNTQGLHAPLRLGMELSSARKIGHLPFLPSHNVMLDSLTGRDIEVAPEDVFNLPEFREVMGQPHAVCERKLGLL